MALDAATIDDVFGRDVVAIARNRGLQAKSVTPDTISPTISSSKLSMSTSTLFIAFSEAVNVSTFVSTAIVIQASANATDGRALTATDITFADDAQSCTVILSDADEDHVKRNTGLATGLSNTFVSYSGLVADLAGNSMETVRNTAAAQITEFNGDSVKPYLTGFGIDMELGNVALNFSEVMNASSVNVRKFSLQATVDGAAVDTSNP